MVLRSKSKEIEEFDSLVPKSRNFPWKNANLGTLDREKETLLFPKSRNFHSKNEKNLRRIESRWWNRVPAWLTHSILSPLDLEILATLAAVPRMRVLDAR